MTFPCEIGNAGLSTLLKCRFWGWRILADSAMLTCAVFFLLGLYPDLAVSTRYFAMVLFAPCFCTGVMASVRASYISMFSTDLSLGGCLVKGDIRPLGNWMFRAVLCSPHGHTLVLLLPQKVKSGTSTRNIQYAFPPLVPLISTWNSKTAKEQSVLLSTLAELSKKAVSAMQLQRKRLWRNHIAIPFCGLFLFIAFPCPWLFLFFVCFICLFLYLVLTTERSLHRLKRIDENPTYVLSVYSERIPMKSFGQLYSIVHWITMDGSDIQVRMGVCLETMGIHDLLSPKAPPTRPSASPPSTPFPP